MGAASAGRTNGSHQPLFNASTMIGSPNEPAMPTPTRLASERRHLPTAESWKASHKEHAQNCPDHEDILGTGREDH